MINNQTQQIPAGYKQTDVGVIPEDWEVKAVKEIIKKIIDNRGKTPPYKSDETIELIETSSISFVSNYPDYSKVTKFVSKSTYSSWFRDHPQKNDILISTVGEYSGSSAIMGASKGTIAQNLVALRTSSIDPQYFFTWTRSNGYIDQLRRVMMSQAQPSLKVPWLLGFELAYPKKVEEQKRIAHVILDIDSLISKLDQLIQKKKNIKQGAMQGLLTGKRRLSGFSGEWEHKAMGAIGTTYGGMSGKVKSDFENGTYPYIPFMNIMSNPIIDTTYFDYVNIKPAENQNKASKDDLFFNGSSETPEEVGMCSALLENIPNLYLNSFCFGFKLNKELKTNSLYLAYFYRSDVGRKLIYFLAQGATRYNLSKNKFLKLEIPYPQPEEQEALSNSFLEMDLEIDKLQTKQNKYIKLKQGMMQQLLTGKIRLIEPRDESKDLD